MSGYCNVGLELRQGGYETPSQAPPGGSDGQPPGKRLAASTARGFGIVKAGDIAGIVIRMICKRKGPGPKLIFGPGPFAALYFIPSCPSFHRQFTINVDWNAIRVMYHKRAVSPGSVEMKSFRVSKTQKL